jgi:hypothetical protein
MVEEDREIQTAIKEGRGPTPVGATAMAPAK